MKSDVHDVECEFLMQTEAAVKVKNLDGDSVWLPKAVCEFEKAGGGTPMWGDTITLTAPQPWLEDMGLV